MNVLQIPVWADNYAYLICEGREAALVDGPEAGPIEETLSRENLSLAAIWNTHHHFDHVGANRALLSTRKIPVYGSEHDRHRIPCLTQALKEGDRVRLGALEAEVFFVPGHTLGHIAYYIPSEESLFCGDTLFAGGCGRLFEGTAEQMTASLRKLARLPDETRLYCAHEYTLSNLRFAVSVEPGNKRLRDRLREVEEKRSRGVPTVPSVLGEEKETNPFLRGSSPEVIETARSRGGAPSEDAVSVFAAIRSLKDSWKG
ncbi:MAG: hydroxyacylglutathione hydrolase [Bdellovibrionota bacterium]